jgi:hypothetical protein
MPFLLFRNNIKNSFNNEESFGKIIVIHFVYYINKVILFSILHNYADHIYQIYNGPEGYIKTNKSLVGSEHGVLDITD